MVTFQPTLRRPAVLYPPALLFYCTSAHIIKFPGSYRCPWLIIERNHGGQLLDTVGGCAWSSCYLMDLKLPYTKWIDIDSYIKRKYQSSRWFPRSQSAKGKEAGLHKFYVQISFVLASSKKISLAQKASNDPCLARRERIYSVYCMERYIRPLFLVLLCCFMWSIKCSATNNNSSESSKWSGHNIIQQRPFQGRWCQQ